MRQMQVLTDYEAKQFDLPPKLSKSERAHFFKLDVKMAAIRNSSQTIDFIRSKLSLILLCMLSAIIGHVSLKKLLIFSLNSLPVLKN